MKLRVWQSSCLDLALAKYHSGEKHFLAVATPGAGKTTMASSLASSMLDRGLVDLIICVTPAQSVRTSFAEDLALHTGRLMNGEFGADGLVLTYQSLSHLKDQFWSIFDRFKVFVIFDEIHHCAGDIDMAGNVWGELILRKMKDRACFTLSLSGTPWRSDDLPVALAQYSKGTGILEADYIYGLQDAIRDNVCRVPQIVAIDNNNIAVLRASIGRENRYKSIQELFSTEKLPFQLLLNKQEVQVEVLRQAVSKLNEVRKFNDNAAGLIVASSVEHAMAIYSLLKERYGESAVLITHKTPDAVNALESFKNSLDRWIVSVGMVSEGTNIPRLQVCCYLSRIKTELYFRQVLGRILRVTPGNSPYAYMFIVAEEKLLSYANRVQEDLPSESTVVIRSSLVNELDSSAQAEYRDDFWRLHDRHEESNVNGDHTDIVVDAGLSAQDSSHSSAFKSQLGTSTGISIFGRFMTELVSMKLVFDEFSH